MAVGLVVVVAIVVAADGVVLAAYKKPHVPKHSIFSSFTHNSPRLRLQEAPLFIPMCDSRKKREIKDVL